MGKWPTNKRLRTTAEVLPKSQRSEPHIKLPSRGILHQEDSPWDTWLWVQQGLLSESQRAMGNGDPTIKWLRISCVGEISLSILLFSVVKFKRKLEQQNKYSASDNPYS